MAKSGSERTYKIGNVAKMLGMTVPGMRMWAETYRDHLSQYANPGKGKARRFTDDDVALFQRVAKMKSDEGQDLTHADIVLKLNTEKIEKAKAGKASSVAVEEPPESPQDATAAPGDAIAPVMDLDTLAPLLVNLQENTVAAERLQTVSSRQDRQAHQIDQLRLLLILVLVVLLLVVVLLLIVALR